VGDSFDNLTVDLPSTYLLWKFALTVQNEVAYMVRNSICCIDFIFKLYTSAVQTFSSCSILCNVKFVYCTA